MEGRSASCQLPQAFQLQLTLVPPYCDEKGRTISIQRVKVNVSMTIAEIRNEACRELRGLAPESLTISWIDAATGSITAVPLDKTAAETNMFIHQATLPPMHGIVGQVRRR